MCIQINASQGANGHTVHSVHTIGEGQNQDGVTVDILNNVPEATLNQEGQIIITGEDGQGKYFYILILYISIVFFFTHWLSSGHIVAGTRIFKSINHIIFMFIILLYHSLPSIFHTQSIFCNNNYN